MDELTQVLPLSRRGSRGRRLALMNGRLIDGSGGEPLEHAVVQICDGRIEAVGELSRIKPPRDYEPVDAVGLTIMPGLIDLHVHLVFHDDCTVPSAGLLPGLDRSLPFSAIRALAMAQRSLSMGITTLRDCGDLAYEAAAVRDAVDAGLIVGPRVVPCGPMLTVTGGHADMLPDWLLRTDLAANVVDGVEGSRRAVRQVIKNGCHWVKVFATGGVMDSWIEQDFSDEELSAVVDEAHRRGARVCAHAMQGRGIAACIDAGVDTIEHGDELCQLPQETVDRMASQATPLVPTLAVAAAMRTQGSALGYSDEYLARNAATERKCQGSFTLARQAGIPIVMGSDAGFGPLTHGTNAAELERYVDLGMSPLEAISSATKCAAKALRQDQDYGMVRPGLRADLIMVDGDPSADIQVLQEAARILLVLKDGVAAVDRRGMKQSWDPSARSGSGDSE